MRHSMLFLATLSALSGLASAAGSLHDVEKCRRRGPPA